MPLNIESGVSLLQLQTICKLHSRQHEGSRRRIRMARAAWRDCDSLLQQQQCSSQDHCVFRPSATASRTGLMESCTCHHCPCHCHGGPPPPPPPPPTPPPPCLAWERDGLLGRSAFTLTNCTCVFVGFDAICLLAFLIAHSVIFGHYKTSLGHQNHKTTKQKHNRVIENGPQNINRVGHPIRERHKDLIPWLLSRHRPERTARKLASSVRMNGTLHTVKSRGRGKRCSFHCREPLQEHAKLETRHWMLRP